MPIDNTKIGICKQCAFKEVPCKDRERADSNNVLMTYICEGFRDIKYPLFCDVAKCGNPAKNYVDDNGVDTYLCDDHYAQHIKFNENLKMCLERLK